MTYWPQGYRPPAITARVYNSVAISVNSGASQTLTFDSERFDTDNLHNVVNPERLTASQSGYYLVTFNGAFAANNLGFRSFVLVHSGGLQIAQQSGFPVVGADHYMSVGTIWYFSAGEYATVLVYQNSGIALNIVATPAKSAEFSMIRVG